MTLQESLDKLKTKIEGSLSPDTVNIMHEATKDLEESGIGESILKVGDQAPEFTLSNQERKEVSLKDLISKGPAIITFYRGVWCPYCNTDLSNLKRYTKEIAEHNATMVSISPQVPKYNQQIVEKQRLNFDLLSDVGNEVARQFGLRWEMVDPLKSIYKESFKIDLSEYNGDNSWTLPVPARFVVGRDGLIKYAEYSVDYTKRPNPDVLIDALKKF